MSKQQLAVKMWELANKMCSTIEASQHKGDCLRFDALKKLLGGK